MEFSKWSWWSQKPSLCIFSESWLFGSGCIFKQASTQAWSNANGSKDAKLPIFGRIGASFSAWQSQFGDTSTTKEIWKFGLPSTTAFRIFCHSAVSPLLLPSSQFNKLKITGTVHLPQPTRYSINVHLLGLFTKTRPLLAHSLIQRRHPLTHIFVNRWLTICMRSFLPAREPHPIPMFLIAPPNPVVSCPLKWLKLIKYLHP